MAFEFLKELLEIQSAAVGGHPLMDNAEFNALTKAAPDFANKLATAWSGDVQEYQRTHGKSAELLFPRMLKNIVKYVPNLPMTPQVQKVVNDLVRLHAASFPAVPQNRRVDTSVWQHEPWARESVVAEYAALCEEYKELVGK